MNNIAEKKISFVKVSDELSDTINNKANELYLLLKNFDASTLPTDDFFKDYFANHHLGKRLIFSIKSSAHILYQSIKKTNKPIGSINIVDYGAGLGTLFMLGSLLNVKRLIYNDHLPEWKNNAAIICNSLNIPVTDYITGDIADVIHYADRTGFKFDIIASRNVIEHIYDLSAFYKQINTHNASAIVYSTTTANYQNPAAHLQHILIHKKTEKKYFIAQRREQIKKIKKDITEEQLDELVSITRGRALHDFTNAVNDYLQKKNIKEVPYLNSNTVDCTNGVWAEHLLAKSTYALIIQSAGFKMEYSAGFWDTNYKSPVANFLAGCLNLFIQLLGKKGYIISPFINVVAYN
ncbi:class I SAM-dependent methyltransferase [Ferruginibacter lapsinanis]|uniref:class I SAM-dependent methyltransferase n=1 Tax=Ferruginibacter lapsinanis TaxID=563172 RepID=UPI001E48C17C|nr:class I SAM-dependent methyltransferase [Ferruginibacter lapsinanis]UEG49056.1 class I SAM-dependent methyltransferase [Ferruginibacter lapsinanis]